MANIKSAIKRARQSEKRRLHNRARRSELKTLIKKVEQFVAAGDIQAAQEAFRIATKKLDKAASKGLIHKNKAARKKSILAQKLNQLLKETSA